MGFWDQWIEETSYTCDHAQDAPDRPVVQKTVTSYYTAHVEPNASLAAVLTQAAHSLWGPCVFPNHHKAPEPKEVWYRGA
ncbi:hypothetical protein TNCV_3119151 [Trichonephila clavipes]|uniref:Uncharacterized protein n=1 Tax=Trichonephila clavipes TaxID=2585209 RepID=A0A8X6W9H0_TRICX|nr:hypothetical protein TNCV_3119151 [Trichonephila clavipes]